MPLKPNSFRHNIRTNRGLQQLTFINYSCSSLC